MSCVTSLEQGELGAGRWVRTVTLLISNRKLQNTNARYVLDVPTLVSSGFVLHQLLGERFVLGSNHTVI